jgi:DNA-binding transcriptional LysR family regulator
MGKPPDSNLIARQLANLVCHLYALPRYLEKFGETSRPADLALHECLGFRASKAIVWTLKKGSEAVGGTTEVSVGGRFQLNSIVLIRRLATLDQGIAFCQLKSQPKTWRKKGCVEFLLFGRGRPRPFMR